MPPLQPVPGVMRCAVKQQLAGVQVINIFHVAKQTQGGWSQGDAQSLVNLMRSSWVTNFTPLQVGVLTLNDVFGVDLTSSVGVSATAPGSTPGTVGGTAAPASVAMCVSWPITRHYRGGHARTYFAGLSSVDHVNANSWQPARITAWANAAAAFRTAINSLVLSDSATVGLVCVHRYSVTNRSPSNPRGEIPVPYLDYLGAPGVDARIDSQRRRLGKDR